MCRSSHALVGPNDLGNWFVDRNNDLQQVLVEGDGRHMFELIDFEDGKRAGHVMRSQEPCEIPRWVAAVRVGSPYTLRGVRVGEV